jgi:hypothetical protein
MARTTEGPLLLVDATSDVRTAVPTGTTPASKKVTQVANKLSNDINRPW